MSEFEAFTKIPRLFRECVITEKIDGTNAQVFVPEDDGQVLAGSRNRWITPEADNFGFARWVHENADALRRILGPGRHFGEWWGAGIQRRYGLAEKRFSLFNTARWSFLNDPDFHTSSARGPVELRCVPELYRGLFRIEAIDRALDDLRENGSRAAPGFKDPEGIIVWHEAARQMFKYTLDGDGHKGVAA